MGSGIFLVGEFPANCNEPAHSSPWILEKDMSLFYHVLKRNACEISTYDGEKALLQQEFIKKSNGKKALLISIIGKNLETMVKDALLEAGKTGKGLFNESLLKRVEEGDKILLQPIYEVLQTYSSDKSSKQSFSAYLQKYNSKKRK